MNATFGFDQEGSYAAQTRAPGNAQPQSDTQYSEQTRSEVFEECALQILAILVSRIPVSKSPLITDLVLDRVQILPRNTAKRSMAYASSTVLLSYPADSFVAWKDEVVKVRELYCERKYRRCTILCSQLLEDAVHPVFKSFLYFYQAICYETLGHIAHNYSSNKIPLLEQARDAFIASRDSLPLPFLTTIDAEYETPGSSPACATLDIATHYYGLPTPSSTYSIQPPSGNDKSMDQNEHSTPIHTRQTPTVFLTPDFDKYSPRQFCQHSTPITRADPCPRATPQHNLQINHKTRLSRTLSSQHALADELVPSPLFSRGPSSRKTSISVSASTSYLQPAAPFPLVTLRKPLPPTPNNRPLPSLPFGHNPQFTRRGRRFIVVPRRKTALSTLISRFEEKGPFDIRSPCSERGIRKEDATYDRATPPTERFIRISAAFKVRDEGNGVKRLDFGDEETVEELSESCNNTMTSHKLCGAKAGLGSDSESDDDQVSDKENTSPRKLIPSPTRLPRPLTSPARSSTLRTISPRKKKQISTINNTIITIPHMYTSQPASSDGTKQTTASHQQPTDITISSLERYNTYLSTFHTSLLQHTVTVTSTIESTRSIQTNHEAEKRARFQGMYGRNPFQDQNHDSDDEGENEHESQSSPTKSRRQRAQKGVGGRYLDTSPIKKREDTRLHSFWSLLAPPALTDKNHSRTGPGIGTGMNKIISKARGAKDTKDTYADTEAARSKRERIKRLRSEGWNVRKEKVGFKGEEWYTEFREAVRREIEGLA